MKIAIQTCIGLDDRHCDQLGLEEPTRARGLFGLLRQEGVIDDRLAEAMARLADPRNLLAHEYGLFTPETAPAQVLEALPYPSAFAPAMTKAFDV